VSIAKKFPLHLRSDTYTLHYENDRQLDGDKVFQSIKSTSEKLIRSRFG